MSKEKAKNEGEQEGRREKSGESEEKKQPEKVYDLEERTARFAEMVIAFAKKVPRNDITARLIPQLVDAGTSVGSNYAEAVDAESRKDYRHKIGISKKESRETKYWIRLVVVAEPVMRAEARPLWQEAKELNLIFGSILRGSE